MSARRPIAPHPGDRDAGARGPGAVTPRRPTSPNKVAPTHRPAPSRPASRATGPAASSSGTRGGAGTDRAPAVTSWLPRMFSARALVLFVVGLLAFVLLFPTVRAYLAQRADNASLVQHVAEARAQNDDLTAELKRWTDDAYVAAQARERLAFVLPGETAFRVVDPETVPDPAAPTVDATGAGPALVAAGTTTPWYATIWESVKVAGAAEVADANTPTPTPSPTEPSPQPDGTP
ncbi:MAG: FtsB family cell division protein [Cellulomonas sp.]